MCKCIHWIFTLLLRQLKILYSFCTFVHLQHTSLSCQYVQILIKSGQNSVIQPITP